MKKSTYGLILLLMITFFSCKNDDDQGGIESLGLILGLDYTQCICYCGGYFIEIDETTYRFMPEFLPPNDLDFSEENLPMSVRLNWEHIDPQSNCEAGDRITIYSIEEQ